MQRLSVLIFSKDDVDKATALIKDIYSIADQIVVIDSSSKSNLKRLEAIKKKMRLKKLEIFHTVALGYADPLRMFGLHKCRYDWVLHLDTDERVNEALKNDVKSVVGSTGAHAFAIKRYEEAHLNGETTSFFTWQIRLYNRNFVRFKGITHEQPIVDGTVERLDDKYKMLHIAELQGKASHEYTKMEMFERFSYEAFNERILDYAFKAMMPAQRDFKKTALGKVIYDVLRIYEALTFRKADEEISNLDYFTLYSLRDLAFQIKMRHFKAHQIEERRWEGMASILPNRMTYISRLNKWRSAKNSKAIFEIAKNIEKDGIIRYLRLDDDDTIRELNEKYEGKKQGVDLLIKLLEDRYYGRDS